MANEKRLIDANALSIQVMDASYWDNQDEDVIWNLVQDAPTVDAVEVVRCKDCRHWQERWKGKYSDEWHGYCDLDDEPVGRWESNFCSYGERKGNEC